MYPLEPADPNHRDIVSTQCSVKLTWDPLGSVGCSSFADNGRYGRLTFAAKAGTTYRIQAGAYSIGSGTLGISMVSTTPAANDAFTSATTASFPLTTSVSTIGASTDNGELISGTCGPIGSTVWYRIAPTSAQGITVDSTGSSFDSVVAAYRGSSIAALTPIACNDDYLTSQQARVTFNVDAGQTYYLQAGGYGSSAGNLTLNFSSGAESSPTATATAIPGATSVSTSSPTAVAATPGPGTATSTAVAATPGSGTATATRTATAIGGRSYLYLPVTPRNLGSGW